MFCYLYVFAIETEKQQMACLPKKQRDVNLTFAKKKTKQTWCEIFAECQHINYVIKERERERDL